MSRVLLAAVSVALLTAPAVAGPLPVAFTYWSDGGSYGGPGDSLRMTFMGYYEQERPIGLTADPGVPRTVDVLSDWTYDTARTDLFGRYGPVG